MKTESIHAASRLLSVTVLVAALGLAGCQSMPGAPRASLYERLGGMPAITAVVDDFVGNVAGDKRINGFFGSTDIPRLKRLLVEQICAGTGGPCTYTGRSMQASHANMGVQEMHFNALVEDLVKTLDKFKVPQQEKGELLAILGPMKSDIVAR
ncbi:MAG: group 1 truncated hemoglobin [Betaproteobacteria bacterium]|nr:group 1 truncated hemoglobin [Betaproteobacteria bacterium]